MSMSMAHIFSKDLSKDISVHDFDDGLLKNGVCGTVAVFADYIVFSGDSSPEADILIPLKVRQKTPFFVIPSG